MNIRMLLPTIILGLGLPVTALAATASPEATQVEVMPDAMTHLVKAPEIDIETIRDPFISHLTLEQNLRQTNLQSRLQRMNAEQADIEASREKDILENFDLTALKLVAILQKGNEHVAMVEDPVGKGYFVRVGRYMGRNNGQVTSIDASTIIVVEPSINPVGELENREVKLTLNEVSE